MYIHLFYFQDNQSLKEFKECLQSDKPVCIILIGDVAVTNTFISYIRKYTQSFKTNTICISSFWNSFKNENQPENKIKWIYNVKFNSSHLLILKQMLESVSVVYTGESIDEFSSLCKSELVTKLFELSLPTIINDK